MSDPMKAIFAAHLGRAPPNKTSKLLRHRSEAPGAVTGHCDTFSKTLEGLCPRGPPSGSLQSVRGDAAMQNKYAEVTPRNFNPTWAPALSDEARKAVNAAFDAMSTWRIETASNSEKNSEQVIEKLAAAARALGWPEQIVDTTRAQMQSITKIQIQTMDQMMDAWEEQIKSPSAMTGSPSAMLSKLPCPASARPAVGQAQTRWRRRTPCSFGCNGRNSVRKPGQTRWRFGPRPVSRIMARDRAAAETREPCGAR